MMLVRFREARYAASFVSRRTLSLRSFVSGEHTRHAKKLLDLGLQGEGSIQSLTRTTCPRKGAHEKEVAMQGDIATANISAEFFRQPAGRGDIHLSKCTIDFIAKCNFLISIASIVPSVQEIDG